MLKLNELNQKYRFICLTIDSDYDISASYDFVSYGDSQVVKLQMEQMLRMFVDICDECVREILQVLWK